MADKKMNLFQKLLEIQKSVDKLVKDKKSGTGSFGYDYVSGGLVLDHIRPKMNELGLLLKQEVVSLENTRIDYKTRNGEKSEILSKAEQRFTWIDVDSGEKDENVFYANGMNDWEKGLGSALTYAERYFLLKFFHIPTDGDDVDNSSRKGTAPEVKPTEKKTATKKEEPKKPVEKKDLVLYDENGYATVTFINILARAKKETVTLAKLSEYYNIDDKAKAALAEHGII